MKKIYIAGKVTGVPYADCCIKFTAAQLELQSLGFAPVNPLGVVGDLSAEWEYAMKKCIIALMNCDAMVILPCWQDSKGATLERQLAEDLNIPIFNFSKSGLTVMKKNLS